MLRGTRGRWSSLTVSVDIWTRRGRWDEASWPDYRQRWTRIDITTIYARMAKRDTIGQVRRGLAAVRWRRTNSKWTRGRFLGSRSKRGDNPTCRGESLGTIRRSSFATCSTTHLHNRKQKQFRATKTKHLTLPRSARSLERRDSRRHSPILL